MSPFLERPPQEPQGAAPPDHGPCGAQGLRWQPCNPRRGRLRPSRRLGWQERDAERGLPVTHNNAGRAWPWLPITAVSPGLGGEMGCSSRSGQGHWASTSRTGQHRFSCSGPPGQGSRPGERDEELPSGDVRLRGRGCATRSLPSGGAGAQPHLSPVPTSSLHGARLPQTQGPSTGRQVLAEQFLRLA